jgi:hypothetical protein
MPQVPVACTRPIEPRNLCLKRRKGLLSLQYLAKERDLQAEN